MDNIEAARIKYRMPDSEQCFDGANSNSTVYYAVKQLGFNPGKPPVLAPCWEVNPFKVKTQASETNLTPQVAAIGTKKEGLNCSTR